MVSVNAEAWDETDALGTEDAIEELRESKKWLLKHMKQIAHVQRLLTQACRVFEQRVRTVSRELDARVADAQEIQRLLAEAPALVEELNARAEELCEREADRLADDAEPDAHGLQLKLEALPEYQGLLALAARVARVQDRLVDQEADDELPLGSLGLVLDGDEVQRVAVAIDAEIPEQFGSGEFLGYRTLYGALKGNDGDWAADRILELQAEEG